MDVVILALVAAQAVVLIALPFLVPTRAGAADEPIEGRPDASEALQEDVRTGKLRPEDLEEADRLGEKA